MYHWLVGRNIICLPKPAPPSHWSRNSVPFTGRGAIATPLQRTRLVAIWQSDKHIKRQAWWAMYGNYHILMMVKTTLDQFKLNTNSRLYISKHQGLSKDSSLFCHTPKYYYKAWTCLFKFDTYDWLCSSHWVILALLQNTEQLTRF